MDFSYNDFGTHYIIFILLIGKYSEAVKVYH